MIFKTKNNINILFYYLLMRENDEFLKMFLFSAFANNNNNNSNYYFNILIIIVFYIYNYISIYINNETIDFNLIYLRIINRKYFNKIYNLKIEGEKTIKIGNWSAVQTDTYSDNFIAFMIFIEKNKFGNVKKIEEDVNANIENDLSEDHNGEKNSNIFFIVNQPNYFKIDKDIYCKITKINSKSDDDSKSKHYIKSFNTDIEILSFNKNTYELRDFINDITLKHKNKIQLSRYNKKYIYTIKNVSNEDDLKIIKWHEHEFNSNKTFNNLFINNKEHILKQINFFQNNKEWYCKKGNPYTLGIGLYGPPGTGKTSFIKALSKMLNRHLIIIPLSKLSTEEQLYDAFYENIYSKKNSKEINFQDKIICFEDIDCMSDIVNNRKNKKDVSDLQLISNIPEVLCDTDSDDNDNKKSYKKIVTIKKEKEISLSYLLNLLDGIVEHPGRIVILTSNHYDKLDPALVRPGRIDIEIELNKASIQQINDFYNYYYDTNIPKDKFKFLKDNIISPCEIVNIYGSSNNKKDFLNKIIEYQKKYNL